MRLTSGIQWNPVALGAVSKKIDRALEETAEWIVKDARAAKTIPRKEGILQGEAIKVANKILSGVQIVQNTPYARRLYYHPEYNFQREPRTGMENIYYKGTTTYERKNKKTGEVKKVTKRNRITGWRTATAGVEVVKRRKKPKNDRERGGFNVNAGAFWWEPYITGEKRIKVERQFLRACRRNGLEVTKL